MENAITFGAQAKNYAAARPHYPEDLFDWIALQVPAHDLAWDVGTGSGQAVVSLAKRFSHVHATDIDTDQIASAPEHDRIDFFAVPSHQSGLPDNSADVITVATALHWFDHELFWKEVERIARPGAIFCAWTYHRSIVDADVQSLLMDPILDILAPYWSEGNRLSWRGYHADELNMPFEVIQMPEFSCELSWTPMQISALVRSWSAHLKARNDGHEQVLVDIEREALFKLGEEERSLILPLNTLAARINKL